MDNWVTIVDVTLRDGLQDQREVVKTTDKVVVAGLLLEAGYRELEVTSMMRADRIPQTADAEQVLEALGEQHGVRRHVLVANRRGLERALATQAEVISFVISASDAHNRENLNCSTKESVTRVRPLIAEALKAGRFVRGTVSTAFGCTIQGKVGLDEIRLVVDTYLAAGVNQLCLADTVGMATRPQFEKVVASARDAAGPTPVALHLHEGPGAPILDLVDDGLACGVRTFDSAIAGLGGCPFAPGAQGNLKAELLIPHLQKHGFETGIEVSRLTEIALVLGMALGRAG